MPGEPEHLYLQGLSGGGGFLACCLVGGCCRWLTTEPDGEETQTELAPVSRLFFLTASLRYNLHTIKFTCFKCTIK